MELKYQPTTFRTSTQEIEVLSTLFWYKSLLLVSTITLLLVLTRFFKYILIKYDFTGMQVFAFKGRESQVLECFHVHLKGFFNPGIEQKGQGIALYAPCLGLQEVYYASDPW